MVIRLAVAPERADERGAAYPEQHRQDHADHGAGDAAPDSRTAERGDDQPGDKRAAASAHDDGKEPKDERGHRFLDVSYHRHKPPGLDLLFYRG
jgi:hypothetical protein